MEIRKVQMTGGSSYVISLPKEWVKNMGIKKNDSLGVITQPDGTLLITNNISGKKEGKIKEINIDSIDDAYFLFRLLVGAYISGYSTIRLTSNKEIPFFVRAAVRKFTKLAIGQEVVEERDNVIVVKDLIDPTEMPFTTTIKRMHVIVKGMHMDAIRALVDKEYSIVRDIVKRDEDVDRLHWLVMRQQNMVLMDTLLAKKMGISINMAVTYAMISKVIERIGDHAVRIVKNIPNDDLKKNIQSLIIEASNMSMSIFNKSIQALFEEDIKSANDTIEMVAKLEEKCKEISREVLTENSEISLHVGYIADSIRRTGDYCADLSEYVINHLI